MQRIPETTRPARRPGYILIFALLAIRIALLVEGASDWAVSRDEHQGCVGRVRNIGEASTPASVPVYFYEGDPDNGGTLLGMSVTTKVLYPAEAEEVVVTLADPPPGLLDGSSVVWTVVDDAMPAHTWHECRVDNNRAFGTGKCPAPPR